jgi:hypothetical protein
LNSCPRRVRGLKSPISKPLSFSPYKILLDHRHGQDTAGLYCYYTPTLLGKRILMRAEDDVNPEEFFPVLHKDLVGMDLKEPFRTIYNSCFKTPKLASKALLLFLKASFILKGSPVPDCPRVRNLLDILRDIHKIVFLLSRGEDMAGQRSAQQKSKKNTTIVARSPAPALSTISEAHSSSLPEPNPTPTESRSHTGARSAQHSGAVPHTSGKSSARKSPMRRINNTYQFHKGIIHPARPRSEHQHSSRVSNHRPLDHSKSRQLGRVQGEEAGIDVMHSQT